MGWRIHARPVLAWCGACTVAGAGMAVIIVVVDGPASGYFHKWNEVIGLFGAMTLWAAYVTGIPVIGLLGLARLARLPRGWSDAGIGGIPGYIAAVAAAVFWLSPNFSGRTALDAAFLALLLLLPGWLAGFTYWHFAGRPRPPY